MNRKLIYTFGFVSFLLMLGVFGIAATVPPGEGKLPATVPPMETTQIVPGATDVVGIPITGEAEPLLTEIFVFYGLIGLTALFLILALLNVANRSTAPYLEHKSPPSDKAQNK